MKVVIATVDFIVLCLLFFLLTMSGVGIGIFEIHPKILCVWIIALLLMPYPLARGADLKLTISLELIGVTIGTLFGYTAFNQEPGGGTGTGIPLLLLIIPSCLFAAGFLLMSIMTPNGEKPAATGISGKQ